MYFDPQTNRFPYPEDTDKHYLEVKKNFGLVFDENYQYVNLDKRFMRKRWWMRLFITAIVFPVVRIRLGLKIKGKKNLKKHKDVISKGVISCSNHVHLWDYLMLMIAIRPIKPYVLVWAPNINGEMGKMMRLVGGIPIPENNIKGTLRCLNDVGEMLNNGGWLQIYPEGSMWEYYRPIRPFKRGAAHFACKFDKPIIPFAYTYRKPGFIRGKIFRQFATFTLHVGEPIFPNKNLSGAEQEIDLTIRMHKAISEMAGIDEASALYPPVFNNSKRVDYYTSRYGVNYKGSH